MAKTEPFEKYTQEYDEWFIKNKNQYLSELNSIKNLIPKNKKGIEIGVGSGRFASPLGIKYGFKYAAVVNPVHMGADILFSRHGIDSSFVSLSFNLEKDLLKLRWS